MRYVFRASLKLVLKRVVHKPRCAIQTPELSQKLNDSRSQTQQNTLLVSEIFHSFQGEGINIGTPSVFLRLAICNLHCWYCDTKYTWLFNEKLLTTVRSEIARLRIVEAKPDLKVYDAKEEVHRLLISEVQNSVLKYACNHLVITGGEPLIQQSNLVPLLEDLKANKRFSIELETNGTITPSESMKNLVDQWNVSPKLDSAGNSRYASEKPQCIEMFKNLNSYFKFVIQDPRDLMDSEKFVEKFKLPRSSVMLMPEATEVSILEERGKTLSAYCEARGYKFSTRLHISMYGNVRGK